MKTSESIQSIAKALAAAQRSFGKVRKDKTAELGRGGTYRYADLAAVCEAIIPALNAEGIAVIQGSGPDSLGVLETRLVHGESGEWIATYTPIYEGRNGGAQGYGSGMTYARRYGLLAAVGVAPEDDDDGAKASGEGASIAGAGGRATISADQYRMLRERLDTAEVDEAKFLAYYGAPSLEEFPVAKFDHAIRTLNKKVAERTLKAAAGKADDMKDAADD